MVWQRIDDQFGVSKKVIRIPKRQRHAVIGLWTLAANYSVRALTNGVLEQHELDELDARAGDIAELVRVGLWHREGESCESCAPAPAGGVVIHDFLVYNPDAASVAAGRESKSDGGRHGNHVRWHERQGRFVAGCEWCESHMRSDTRVVRESLRNPPGPVPSPSPDVTDDGDSRPPVTEVDARVGDGDEEITPDDLAAVGIRNLDRVRAALERVVGPLSGSQAIDVTRAVILLANEPVRSVEAYVEAACVNSPAEVRVQFEARRKVWP